MCEKRESQDQRSLGNVRASNRPSDVESDFKGFFDGAREDARDVIQSVYGSEKKKRRSYLLSKNSVHDISGKCKYDCA